MPRHRRAEGVGESVYFLRRILRSFAIRALAAADPFFNAPADFEDLRARFFGALELFFFRLRDGERDTERREVLRDPFNTRSKFCTAGLC